LYLFLITLQIYNDYFDFANFFKDIFKLFSKVLKIKEKKQQLTAPMQKQGLRGSRKFLLLISFSAKGQVRCI
jgi:hypothetical protein